MTQATYRIVGIQNGQEVDFSDDCDFDTVQAELSYYPKLEFEVIDNNVRYTHYYKENDTITFIRIREFA